MPPSYIPPNLRRLVEEDAKQRCGYCLTAASFMPVRFEIEHIIPASLDGETVRATVEAMKLNHDWWIECRTEWVLRGNFPPTQ